MTDAVPQCDRAHTLETLIRAALEGPDADTRDRAAAELLKAGVFVWPPVDE